jgi:hypothetical protein
MFQFGGELVLGDLKVAATREKSGSLAGASRPHMARLAG